MIGPDVLMGLMPCLLILPGDNYYKKGAFYETIDCLL